MKSTMLCGWRSRYANSAATAGTSVSMHAHSSHHAFSSAAQPAGVQTSTAMMTVMSPSCSATIPKTLRRKPRRTSSDCAATQSGLTT